MTGAEAKRLMIEAGNIWPGRVDPDAAGTWARLLSDATFGDALAALDRFASNDFPPTAGQIARAAAPRETERDRCRRQRKQAAEYVKAGTMTRADFDWYERTYWGEHDPIKRENQ